MPPSAAASAPAKTPKKGLLRKWILMPERRKMLLVACVSVIGFLAFRSLFFISSPKTFEVSHVLTAEEKESLRQQVIQEQQDLLNNKIDDLRLQTNLKKESINSLLVNELAKPEGLRNQTAIQELSQRIADLDKSTAQQEEEFTKQYKSEIDGIVTLRLAQLQKEIIDSRANEMLGWFCDADIDDDAASTPIDTAVVDLGNQPCIGVASEGDPAVPLRRFSMNSPDVSRAVSAQLLASLTNRTGEEAGNPLYGFTELANSQYNPQRVDRCCDRFLFGAHPVFGMFYKITVPLKSEDEFMEGEDSADDYLPGYFSRTMCFRRKLHPRPVVRPLTPESSISHLKHPEKLPTFPESGSDARRLADKKKADAAPVANTPTFAPGTVHVILPFRASHLSLLPSLLKNFGRVKAYTANPFRIILAPISLAADYSFDVLKRLQDSIAVAGPALNLDITISESLTAAELTKPALLPLLRTMIDAKTLPDFAEPTAELPGLLPNAYLGALFGALKLVPKVRAPVLILDSSTYAVPNDIIKKTLWRIVNGRVIYAPIAATFDDADAAGVLLGNGNIGNTEAELSARGQSANYLSTSWWQDIGGIEDFDMDRRRLRATTKRSRTMRRRRLFADPTGASGAIAKPSVPEPSGSENENVIDEIAGSGGKRRLMSARAVEEPVTDSNAGNVDEGYFNYVDDDLPAAYGYEEPEIPMQDDFEENYEWDGMDPYLVEDAEELYGVGEGLGSEDGYHAYYMPTDDDAYDEGYGIADLYNPESQDPDIPNYEVNEGTDTFEDDDFDFDNYNNNDLDMYAGFGGSVPVPLNTRMTILGATKSDIGSMLYRILDSAADSVSDEELGFEEADNCVLRRMLSAARNDNFRIVRSTPYGLLVDSSSTIGGADDEETFPCGCNNDNSPQYCLLVLPQTAVDDSVDEDRVNCVLTSLLASENLLTAANGNKPIKEEGVSKDIEVASIVTVSHAVRFIRPSVGIEIVAKVFAAPTPVPAPAAPKGGKRRIADDANASPAVTSPEVFAFQWLLSSKIVLSEEI